VTEGLERAASPLPVSPYIHLMKLRIAALLLLVAAAGYVSTSGPRIDPMAFGTLMVSGVLASGGASAINHYIDRDLDAVMHRTSSRPLPRRTIDPPGRALAFGRSHHAAARELAPALHRARRLVRGAAPQ